MFTTINIILAVVSLAALVAFVLIMIAGFKRSLWWGLALLFLPFTTLIYGIKYWQEVKKPFLAYVGSNVLAIAMLGFVFTQLGGMEAVQMAQKMNDGTMTEQDAAQFMKAGMDGMEEMGAGGREEMISQMRADPNVTEEDVKRAERMLEQIDAVATGEESSFQEGWQEQSEDAPLQLAMASPDAQETKALEEIEAELEDKIAAMEAKMAQLDEPLEEQADVEEAAASEDEVVNADDMGYPTLDYVESPIKEETVEKAKKTSGPVALAEAGQYIGDILSVTTRSGVTRRATLKDVYPGSLEFQRRASGGSITYKIGRHEIKSLVLD